MATFGSSCDLDSLRPVEIGQNSFVYAADNSLLGVIPAEQNRQPVPLKQISPWMPKATVAIEDRRFYEHGGIDVEGIARALWENVSAGKVVQGGSTITQQLVRNLYPVSRERTVERKVKEACLAIKLNDAWSKDRILATYMNQVYYGNLAYGIEAAAQTYFSKHASELTLPEAALLAGLPQAPSDYDPFNNPGDRDRAPEPGAARDARQGDIDREAVRLGVSARARPEGRASSTRRSASRTSSATSATSSSPSTAPRACARAASRSTRPSTRASSTRRRGRSGGAVRADDPAAAVISINPRNGAIRAMTAVTPGNSKNQFNLLSQARRQSGSTFKTFVLAAAVEKGINPATSTYLSAPFFYRPTPDGDCDTGAGGWWCPETYDHGYTGWTSIEQRDAALRQHRLRAAHARRDPEAVAAMARKLGVRSPLDVNGAYVPSIGPRRDGGLAARPGLRLRDARGRRHLLGADGDPQGRPPERQGHAAPAGASPSASA